MRIKTETKTRTQPAFTCSKIAIKIAIERLGQGVKYVKLIKTPERRHWCCSGLFTVSLKHVSHLVLVSLLLILTIGNLTVNISTLKT